MNVYELHDRDTLYDMNAMRPSDICYKLAMTFGFWEEEKGARQDRRQVRLALFPTAATGGH